jgi:histidinol-phosphate aminotransferase
MQPRDLSSHVPYEAGGGIEEVARELDCDPGDLVKLASNENPHGPSPAAVAAVQDAAETVHGYPKASHSDLTDAIADRWSVASEQVWLANGADGALDYLARAALEPGDVALVPKPGFAYYAMSARFHHGLVAEYPVERDADGDGFAMTPDAVLPAYEGERVVYLTTPHNPTGATFALEEVRAIAESTGADTLVVVDEAYGEYTDAESAVSLVDERDDVAVLRTFSKAFGLAGVRLGYALVPEDWADAYARVNTPFAASELACRAGLAALDDDEHVERSVATAREARREMHARIDAPTFESGGNFVLVEVGDGAGVAQAMKERGVIVRDTTSFGLPECVRITCGTPEETDRAIETLNEVLAE